MEQRTVDACGPQVNKFCLGRGCHGLTGERFPSEQV